MMRGYRIIAPILVLLIIPTLFFAQSRRGNKGIARKIIGTWKLVSIEATRPNGEIIHDWGENPTGLIIYDSTGHMAVQLMRDPRPTSASSNLTTDEMKAAFEGYLAYFGTYEINEMEGTVAHHVQSSLRSYDVGTDYKRFYKLSSDRLTLTTPPMERHGEQRVHRLTWERVK
jgi:lipocalin-like protein